MTIGNKLPVFSLLDQDGKTFNTSDTNGFNFLVFFYPKDFSAMCTKQACAFRDAYALFKESDTILVGINSQEIDSHKSFSLKNNLNFRLLSDTQDAVRNLFQLKNLKNVLQPRETFIFNKKGELVHQIKAKFNVEKHINESLAILKQFAQEKNLAI